MNELPLRDIHLPTSISWWPLAFGWWVLVAAILTCLVLIILFVVRRLKPTLQKETFKALEVIEQKFIDSEDATHSIAELSALLRRVILSQNRTEQIAGITGRAWLELLDKNMDKPEFSQGCGQVLLAGPYQKCADKEDVSELIQLCKKWAERL